MAVSAGGRCAKAHPHVLSFCLAEAAAGRSISPSTAKEATHTHCSSLHTLKARLSGKKLVHNSSLKHWLKLVPHSSDSSETKKQWQPLWCISHTAKYRIQKSWEAWGREKKEKLLHELTFYKVWPYTFQKSRHMVLITRLSRYPSHKMKIIALQQFWELHSFQIQISVAQACRLVFLLIFQHSYTLQCNLKNKPPLQESSCRCCLFFHLIILALL